MCEVSDIDEWMDLHHGNPESGVRKLLKLFACSLRSWTSNLDEVKPTEVLKGLSHVEAQ